MHPHTPDTNLRYGLRSGGGSFGIVTEFLIKSYPHAETLSFVAFVFIKDSNDLRQLIKAGQDGKYAINILQPLYFRRPKPSLLVSILSVYLWIDFSNGQFQLAWGLIKVPQIIKWKSGKSISPILVSVVDINSNNGATAAGPAINFLKSYGLEVANDNANLNEQFGLSKGDLNVDDQESVYLTKGNHYFFIACNISF